jgi:hypothetical protein
VSGTVDERGLKTQVEEGMSGSRALAQDGAIPLLEILAGDFPARLWTSSRISTETTHCTVAKLIEQRKAWRKEQS